MALTDEAIEKVRQMIVDGELRPGQRLPKEPDLAERLGLSRNSLREAVRALALINVLDVRRGDGTYVTSLEPSLLINAMSYVVELHRDDTVLEIFEVRRVLEPAATGMAAVRMRDGEVAELRALLDELSPDPSIDDLIANDLEFHRLVATGSQNRALCSLIETMSTTTHRARIWRGLTQTDAVARTVREHYAILEGIEARNPEVARAWATVHVAGVEDWLRTAATAS